MEQRNQQLQEQFKQGFRSVYRSEKHLVGEQVRFLGDIVDYRVDKSGALVRLDKRVRGKKARKADKKARRLRNGR